MSLKEGIVGSSFGFFRRNWYGSMVRVEASFILINCIMGEICGSAWAKWATTATEGEDGAISLRAQLELSEKKPLFV